MKLYIRTYSIFSRFYSLICNKTYQRSQTDYSAAGNFRFPINFLWALCLRNNQVYRPDIWQKKVARDHCLEWNLVVGGSRLHPGYSLLGSYKEIVYTISVMDHGIRKLTVWYCQVEIVCLPNLSIIKSLRICNLISLNNVKLLISRYIF